MRKLLQHNFACLVAVIVYFMVLQDFSAHITVWFNGLGEVTLLHRLFSILMLLVFFVFVPAVGYSLTKRATLRLLGRDVAINPFIIRNTGLVLLGYVLFAVWDVIGGSILSTEHFFGQMALLLYGVLLLLGMSAYTMGVHRMHGSMYSLHAGTARIFGIVVGTLIVMTLVTSITQELPRFIGLGLLFVVLYLAMEYYTRFQEMIYT